MIKDFKIGFIGAGTMGKAIIKELINTNFIDKKNLHISEATSESADAVAKELAIHVEHNNKKLVQDSDIIMLCVKPYYIKEVITEIKEYLTEDKVLISIAAGITTKSIEETARINIPVIRVMPNTPILVGEGMSAVCKGKYAQKTHIDFAVKMFSRTGKCIELDEKMLNAVTGISGSGPAFAFLIIDALSDGGVKLGLTKKDALVLAAQTLVGAGTMVLETGKHPSILKDEVTTPGGTTIEGLSVLEDEGVRTALIKAVVKTAEKAEKLSL
jgi:pyrroline-5-carboxylate reductase